MQKLQEKAKLICSNCKDTTKVYDALGHAFTCPKCYDNREDI